MASRAGRPGERSREREEMVVLGSVKLAGRAMGLKDLRIRSPDG